MRCNAVNTIVCIALPHPATLYRTRVCVQQCIMYCAPCKRQPHWRQRCEVKRHYRRQGSACSAVKQHPVI